MTIADNVVIDAFVNLTADCGTIEIGADSYVGVGKVIVAAEQISIGRDALIAAFVTMRDQDHGVGGWHALPAAATADRSDRLARMCGWAQRPRSSKVC